jgi:hypothetical protein
MHRGVGVQPQVFCGTTVFVLFVLLFLPECGKSEGVKMKIIWVLHTLGEDRLF